MQLDHPTMLAVRARRLLVRPLARRALAAAVAAATGVTVVSQVRAADAARRRWSHTRPVAVAQRDLRPGERLDRGDAEVRELPRAAVARSAVAEAPVGVVVRQPIAAGEPLVAERLGAEGRTGVAALLPDGHRAIAVPVGPVGVPPVRVGDTVDVLTLGPPELSTDTGPDVGWGEPTFRPDAVDPTEADADPAVRTEADPDATVPDPDDPTGDGPDAADPAEAGPGEAALAAAPVQPLVERAPVVAVADEEVTIAVPEADAPHVAYAALHGTLVLTLAIP